jgi:hypothetical protein
MAPFTNLFSWAVDWGKKQSSDRHNSAHSSHLPAKLPQAQANFLTTLEGGSSGTGMTVPSKEDPVKAPEDGKAVNFDEHPPDPAAILEEASRLLQESKTTSNGVDPDSLPDPPEFNNFHLFLKDRDCRAFFAKFCNETIKSPENILFYETVDLFKNISSVATRRVLAKEIYHRYLRTIGPTNTFDMAEVHRIVNLNSQFRDTVRDNLELAPPDLFQACQEEILALMYLDALPKFMHSELKVLLKLHMCLRDSSLSGSPRHRALKLFDVPSPRQTWP